MHVHLIHKLKTLEFLASHNKDWMASWYSKVFWNKITLLANLVFFFYVFNFRWKSPTSKHTLYHSLCPLLDFFVHVIIFYKVHCVPFKLISQKPTQTLISFQAYWHVLLKTWPKHDLCQQTISVRGTHLAIEKKIHAKVDRLSPSFFT
jgi:hypothetical protein